MRSAASNTSAKCAKGWGTGEDLLHSLANPDRPDREEVEDDVCESASDRSDARDTDDDDMWNMKPLGRDKLSTPYLQMPRMQWMF
eukprot:12279319-Karenia_brevis.AAC.1